MASVFAVMRKNGEPWDNPDVFSTREKAEVFVGDGGESFRIVEVELDPNPERVVRIHHVAVDFKTVEVVGDGKPFWTFAIKSPDYTSDCYRGAGLGHEDAIIAWSSISHEHAIEAARAWKKDWIWRNEQVKTVVARQMSAEQD